MTAPLLRLANVAKAYAGVRALDGVSLDVKAGEIHAVLGENGAGKSTLMKIIYGAVRPDAGTIEWEGRPVAIDSPALARRLGIAMIFQHFALFESSTVLENVSIALADPMPRAALVARLAEIGERYGLAVNPEQYVHRLSVGERQRVEIARSLVTTPRLLIMDEPTSVLPPQAIERLFETLRRLAAEGTAILYVSHKLDEIRRLCHRATIIRQGKLVGEADPRVESEARLAEMMIGRTFPRIERRAHPEGDIALELAALSIPADGPFGTALENVSLRVHAGEVLGIAGISGNGQAELLAALSGERRAGVNDILLDGKAIGDLDVRARRKRGLALVPEERLGVGAVPALSLVHNGILTAYGRGLVRSGVVDRGAAERFAKAIIEAYDVRCSGMRAHAGSLSGGNLQKFIVGREIEQQPKVLVLGQPTWGVDVAATALIRQRILDLAARGVGVLVISEDLGEILELCDRVAVIAGGRLSPTRKVHETDAEEIGRWMAGGFEGGKAVAAEAA